MTQPRCDGGGHREKKTGDMVLMTQPRRDGGRHCEEITGGMSANDSNTT
jgi:hypothetical protein